MLRGWVERGFTAAEAHALLEEELRRSLLNASAHTAFGRVLETDFTVARRRAAATRSASAAIRERTEQTKRQLGELMGELTQRTAELAALCESRSPAADAAASSRSAVALRRMGY